MSMPNGHDEEITVAAALRLGPLSEGVPEVLAGAGSLKNPIRWVHSGEWLEMASVLRGGELLLTTGMGFPDSPSAQRKFIASLAERSIAGLVIELHTSIDQVPRAVVEEAEARHLPLIVLHREVPFVEVTESLHREIVGQQALALEHAEQAHRRFTELILDGAGVPEVLEELADLIGNPVLLQKADEGVLYHHPHTATDAAVLAAWDTVTHRLPEALEHVSVPVEVGHGRTWGTLIALALSSPLRKYDRIVLDRGASVIALSMLRRNAEPSMAARRRGQFIASLMRPGAAIDEREATEMAAELGFDRRALLRLSLVAIRASRWLEPEESDEAPWPTLWREITRELDSMRMSALAGVLPGEGPGDRGGIALRVRSSEVAGRISRTLRSASESRLSDQELIVLRGLGDSILDARSGPSSTTRWK